MHSRLSCSQTLTQTRLLLIPTRCTSLAREEDVTRAIHTKRTTPRFRIQFLIQINRTTHKTQHCWLSPPMTITFRRRRARQRTPFAIIGDGNLQHTLRLTCMFTQLKRRATPCNPTSNDEHMVIACTILQREGKRAIQGQKQGSLRSHPQATANAPNGTNHCGKLRK